MVPISFLTLRLSYYSLVIPITRLQDNTRPTAPFITYGRRVRWKDTEAKIRIRDAGKHDIYYRAERQERG